MDVRSSAAGFALFPSSACFVKMLFSQPDSVRAQCPAGYCEKTGIKNETGNTSIFKLQTTLIKKKGSPLPKIMMVCAFLQLALYKQSMTYCC